MISRTFPRLCAGSHSRGQLRTESALCAAALRRGPGSGFRAVLPLCAGCGDAGRADARPAAVVRRAPPRRRAAGGYGRALFRLVALPFESYNLMDAGIASTILFVYPVMVAVIMAVGFRERVSRSPRLSIPWPSPASRCSTKAARRDAHLSRRRAGLSLVALLCGLHRRRQPLVAHGPSDRETHLLLLWFSARWSMSFGCGAVPICNPSLRP